MRRNPVMMIGRLFDVGMYIAMPCFVYTVKTNIIVLTHKFYYLELYQLGSLKAFHVCMLRNLQNTRNFAPFECFLRIAEHSRQILHVGLKPIVCEKYIS